MYFEPPMLRWIAACALYPTLHWDLTLWLGNQISEIRNRKSEKKRDKISNSNPTADSLCTFQNLRELTRLSWFIEGEMPDSVRAKLLDWFEQRDKTLLQELRLALATELGKNAPPSDSVAFEPFRMTVATQEWLATTDAERKKQLEREIADLLERGVDPDFIVLKYLDTPRSPLHFEMPKSWRKFVYNGGVRGLGFLRDLKNLWWLLVLLVAGLVAVFYPYKQNLTSCSWDKIVSLTTEKGKTHYFCLSDTLSALSYDEQIMRQALNKRRFEDANNVGFSSDGLLMGPFIIIFEPNFDSMMVIKITGNTESRTDQLFHERFRNFAVDYYHLAKIYNSEKKNDSACFMLNLASKYDSLDNDIKVAQTLLCGKTDKNLKANIAPQIDGTVVTSDYNSMDFTANKPLNNVQITGVGIKTRTDIQGKYSLKLPPQYPTQTIALTFAKAGFQTVRQRMRINNVRQLPTVTLNVKEN